MIQPEKIAIVTGANRGIGLEISKQLAASGFRVIMACRDIDKGKAAAAVAGGTAMVLDMASEKSIRDFAAEVKTQFGRVDVLVNNAGTLSSDDHRILDAQLPLINETFAINAVGPLLLTQAIAPLMPAGSRVIMISSGGGSMSDAVGGWAAVYCVSKTLLNAITRQLANELSSRKIAVNSVCPGWVRTDMGGKSAPRSVEQGAATAVWLATTGTVPTGKFLRDKKEIPF